MTKQPSPIRAPQSASQTLKSICVYCGSNPGHNPAYMSAARYLGTAMAKAGIGLVFGGGESGIMGAVANAVMDGGGAVTGIIPDFLIQREHAFTRVKDLVVVPDMHTRKQMMFERSDAFVVLPGGIGTLEELAEQLTWLQLERHHKPLLIADIAGFWRPLLSLFAHMHNEGFIRTDHELRYRVAEKIEDVLPMLQKQNPFCKQG